MSLKDRLRRLERTAEGKTFSIPQPGGDVATFPATAGLDAMLSLIEGVDHPLAQAARRSPDPQWNQSFYAVVFPEDTLEGSEP